MGARLPERTRLVFEVDAADAERIRDTLAWMRSTAGASREDLDDGALLAALCERAVQATEVDPVDAPTLEPYRVVVEHCPSCRETAGREHELSDTVIAEARCDAELVDLREGPERGAVAHTVPPKLRPVVLHRDRHRCRVPVHDGRLGIELRGEEVVFWLPDGQRRAEPQLADRLLDSVQRGQLGAQTDGAGALTGGVA